MFAPLPLSVRFCQRRAELRGLAPCERTVDRHGDSRKIWDGFVEMNNVFPCHKILFV